MVDITIRARATGGDLTHMFQDSDKIEKIKTTLFQNWPTEGDYGRNPPASTSEICLILNGRILQSNETIAQLRKEFGMEDTTTMVMLLTVRKPPPGGAANPNDKIPKLKADVLQQRQSQPQQAQQSSGCCVVM